MTGSYDCTAKIWGKQSLTEITLLHTISLHNDSVWDLKLKGETLVTGGLDGAIGIFTLSNGNLQTNNFFKVRCVYLCIFKFWKRREGNYSTINGNTLGRLVVVNLIIVYSRVASILQICSAKW